MKTEAEEERIVLQCEKARTTKNVSNSYRIKPASMPGKEATDLKQANSAIKKRSKRSGG